MKCNRKPNAGAVVKGGTDHPEIKGEVLFYQTARAVLVTARIMGLPKNNSGFFGFHIHEGKDCGGDGFPNTGGHFNSEGALHPSHAGDLPPLLSCGGRAFLQVETDRFRVGDIIGRTVVIHEKTDDFTTQPSGNAGEKIACGEIKKV